MKFRNIIASVMTLALLGSIHSAYVKNTPDRLLSATAESEEEYKYDYYGNKFLVGAYDGFTYRKYSDHAAITGCEGELRGDIVIPSEINGLPVTEIIDNAFYYQDYLTSVTIPDNVTSVGSNVFYDCSELEVIYIPESAAEFGEDAFHGTKWLKDRQEEAPLVIVNNFLIDGTTCTGDVVIPEGVVKIGDGAFLECSELTSVVLPESLISVGENGFRGCTELTSIVFPENTEAIGAYAFLECPALESVTIPESLTYFGGAAFLGTPWLESMQNENPMVIINDILMDATTCSGDVVIPDNVIAIDCFAFLQCTDMTSVTIPDSVKEIREGAFDACTGLTEIIIPNSVGTIGTGAFADCSALETVKLPDGLEIIETYMFYKCKSLTGIDIPKNVSAIGLSAFYKCVGLTEVTLPESVNALSIAFWDCENLERITILNPECSIIPSRLTIGDTTAGCVICGYDNSTAQEHAEIFGYEFESLGPAPKKSLAGDSNCDGEVNMADAVLIMQAMSNPDKYGLNGSDTGHITAQGWANGDVTDRDGVTNKDALEIQKYMLKLVDKLEN